ncbi:putative B3 domain-containing protein Os04g0347400 [Typha angustifolia]|uniref:putative B3 domain-containing protein Os04g0347400 n=1 Tax=Typha angustifolia TaxID=59011 RepID=UPI003C2F30C9
MATNGRPSAAHSHKRLQFFKVLLPESLEKLRIPPKFAVHLLKNNIVDGREATIFSPLGKFWHVELIRDGSQVFFSRGWKEFLKAHDLLVGYLLVFRYEGNLVFTIKVFDLSACCKDFSYPIATRDQVSHDEEQRNMPSSNTKRKNEITSAEKISAYAKPSLPHFKRTIKAYHLTRKSMSVPKGFCSSAGLSTKREIILRNSQQTSWPVNFGISGHNNYLGKGWAKLCGDNNIKEGDRCIFELVEENVLQFRVVDN